MSQRESDSPEAGPHEGENARDEAAPEQSGRSDEVLPNLPPLPPIPAGPIVPSPSAEPPSADTVRLAGSGAVEQGPTDLNEGATIRTGPVSPPATPEDFNEGATIRTGPLPGTSPPPAASSVPGSTPTGHPGAFGEGATIRTGPVSGHPHASVQSPSVAGSGAAGSGAAGSGAAGSGAAGQGAASQGAPVTSHHPATASPVGAGGSSWDSNAVSRPFSQPHAGGASSVGSGGSAVSSGPLPVGAMIAGRYRVIKVLGVGGMGEVYHVLDEVLEVEVALKVMRSEVAADVSFLQRFRNELLVARQITHPNVVRIHDLGQDGPLLFMTMDLVKGQSLGDWMEKEGPVEHSRAVEIVRQVADALQVAHEKGVVHRDLKPANILLDAEGQSYVTDFGIARSHSFSGLTRTGEVLGTPDYLAPEQARGEEVDARTDIYALGLIFFEMVSGKKPFVGGTLYEILAQHMNGQTRTFQELGVPIEPGLEAVISKCLAPDRAERYGSAAELVADLADLERPRLRRAREKRLRKIRKTARVAGIAAGGMLVSALGWWAWTTFQSAEKPTPATGEQQAADASPAPEVIPDLPSVLVLPLQTDAGAEPEQVAWANHGLPDQLRSMLAESGELRVVPGARVEGVIRDLELSANRLSDADQGFLADLFAADHLISGTLAAAEDWSVSLDLEAPSEAGVTSEDHGQPVLTGRSSASDPAQAVEEVAAPLAKALGLEGLARVDAGVKPSALTDFYLAQSAMARGDLGVAADSLERSVSADPNWMSAWLSLAEVRRAQGLEQECVDAAERAVALAASPTSEPSDSTAAGSTPEATEAEPSSEPAVIHPSAYRAEALLAELQGRPEDMLSAFLGRLESRPLDTEARFDLALTYGGLGQLAPAVEQLEILSRIDPSDSRTWYYLGRYTIVGGDPERAVDDYLVEALSQARRASDESGEAQILNALGIGYRHLGKVEQASRRYADAAEIQQALGDRNGYAKAQMNLADLSIELGRFEAAEQQLNQALTTLEEVGNRLGQANAVNALGVLRERQGRFEDALDQYRQALRLRLEEGDRLSAAESYYNVGFAYLEMANYTDAGLNLEQALGIYRELGNDYGVMLVLQSRASAGIAQGDWKSAERDLIDALATSRELQIPLATAASHGSLGRLALLQGRYDDGFAALEKGLEIVEQQGNLQGRVEMTLSRAEGLLNLGAGAEAGALLAHVEGWLGETGSSSQRSTLRRLQGESARSKGELETAEFRFQEAVTAAEAGSSAAVLLAAQLAASTDSQALGDVVAAAGRLGHRLLELRALEARAETQLQQGVPGEAESDCRQALGIARKLGEYGRNFRLLAIQAQAQRAGGDEQAADRTSASAREELKRIRLQIPPDLADGFDALPIVKQLRPGS